jgi:hypothetical protein
MNQFDSENTQRLPESGSAAATDDGKDTSLVPTHQLTPISGSNGYQQQIGFDLSQPLELSVTNINGSVKLKSSNEDTIWLVVRRNDNRDDAPLNLTVSVEGNKISIHPDWQLSSSLAGLAKKIKDQLKNGLEPGDWNLSKLRFGNDFDFDIRVEVPRNLAKGSKIALRTTSGEINADGVAGDLSSVSASGSVVARDLEGVISIHTASGSVKAENIQNSLEVNTASGSIKVNGGEAWTALRTVSGSINVNEFTMRNAKLASVSGSMKLNVAANNALAPYGFDTVSGSIQLNLTLPATSSGPTLNFRSVSGSGNASGAWKSSGKRSWAVGDGQGAPFKVSSVSGSLNTYASVEGTVIARDEPLPNSDRYDNDTPSEPGDAHFEMNHDIHRNAHHDIHNAHHDLHREDINRAVNWAKEAARRFTQPLDEQPTAPVPPRPATPATPETPATPATPVTPATPPTAQAAQTAPPIVPEPTVQDVPRDPVVAEPVVTEPVIQQDVVEPVVAEPQVASTAPAERPEDEEALKVLEALERGDIDVEEALARIERAENPTP